MLTIVSASILWALAFADEPAHSEEVVESAVELSGVRESFVPAAATVPREEFCGNQCQVNLDYEGHEICGRVAQRLLKVDPEAHGKCLLAAVIRYEACIASCPVAYSDGQP